MLSINFRSRSTHLFSKLMFLGLLTFILIGPNASQALAETEYRETAICSADYNLLCATNGTTYSNTCWMNKAGAEFDYWGECENPVEPETKLEYTQEMEDAAIGVSDEMILLISEIESAEEEGYDLAVIEEMFNDLIIYEEEVGIPTDEESFWNAIDFTYDFIDDVYHELDLIYTNQDFSEPEDKEEEDEPEDDDLIYDEPEVIDFGEISEMRQALYEIDDNLRRIGIMLEWFSSLGADLDPLEDEYNELERHFALTERYLNEENADGFWNSLPGLQEYIDEVFLVEMKEVLLKSDIGQFFEEIGFEIEAIEEEVAYLEEMNKYIPESYEMINFLNEQIGYAFDNEDFERATNLIDSLITYISSFWIELGQDDYEISFEPPAGYEDEVRTFYSDNPFPDTSDNSLEGKAAADLYRRAVIGGFPDGEFKGSRAVNRAEAAKFLLLAAGIEVMDTPNNGKFKDVIDGEWYTPFVMTAAEWDIIAGHPDGSFKPADSVNTAEFLKMLNLTFGAPINQPFSYADVPSSSWFASYAGIAEAYDLFPGRDTHLNPGQELTRNEVAVAIYQYLKNQYSIQYN